MVLSALEDAARQFGARSHEGVRFHDRALAESADLWHGHLEHISLEGLTGPLMRREADALPSDLRDIFAETITDLADLIDEIRFSGALAALLIADHTLQQREAELDDDRAQARENALPVEAMALLRNYFAAMPMPATLFEDPHTPMAGQRVLSRWFAGQLIDSALFRLVAGLDRLAVLLTSAAGKRFAVGKDGLRYPAFRAGDLEKLKSAYPEALWEKVRALTDHPLFKFLMDARNGFTHSRRLYSELHGHYRIVYGVPDIAGEERDLSVQEGIDPAMHLAVLLATYNEILRPAIGLTRDCLNVDADEAK